MNYLIEATHLYSVLVHIPYFPCRCLCRGLVQITLTTPWRRIILQCSQILLTEVHTFIELLPKLIVLIWQS